LSKTKNGELVDFNQFSDRVSALGLLYDPNFFVKWMKPNSLHSFSFLFSFAFKQV